MKGISSYGVALFGVAVFATVSQAQYQNPAYSPYLNLTRGGNAALNYYGLVRPQISTANAFQSLAAGHTQNVGASPSGNQLLQTGNRASFMTHTRFFMNQGGGRGTGANPYGGLNVGTPGATQAGAQQRTQTPTPSAYGR